MKCAECEATFFGGFYLPLQRLVNALLSTSFLFMAPQKQYQYPSFQRLPLRENIHEKSVPDPYRWLEDPDSKDTQHFVSEQNKLTEALLNSYPHKSKVIKSLTDNWDYEKFQVPFHCGSRYFYFHNSGLQQQNVLFEISNPSEDSSSQLPPKIFFDPNTLSEDGTVSLQTFRFSENASYFAYALSESGSDWCSIYCLDSTTKEALPDRVEWVKFSSISWTKDEKGFFYCRYPKPTLGVAGGAGTETGTNKNALLCYHHLRTSQNEDQVVFKDEANPTHRFSANVSHDGHFLLMTTTETTAPVNKLAIAHLENKAFPKSGLSFRKVVDDFSASYDYITNNDQMFYFMTNKNAPNYKVVSYDFAHPEKGFVEVVAESKNVLDEVVCVNERFMLLHYLEDVKSVLQVHELENGKFVTTVPLPVGSVMSISAKKEDSFFFFKFTSFTVPGILYSYSFKHPNTPLTVYKQTKLSSSISLDNFVTKQVWYDSKDGTRIPMFIVHLKDLPLNGNNPTLLYGYGGFSISLTPSFSPSRMTFLYHFRGVLAIPNLRGGAEYGEKWHEAGCLKNKQNVFDDFQYAAKYLIREKYTCKEKLSIQGGSNGGLLVGACVNQAPELFGCALAHVGVLDMLRFHKFTIGYAWKSDYGDPDMKEDFLTLVKYSPVHNVGGVCSVVDWTDAPPPPAQRDLSNYPAVLVLTSDHDDRVVPLHSLKFIATLQHEANYSSHNPLMARIETKAGHGAGKPTRKIIEETADVWVFVAVCLGLTWSD